MQETNNKLNERPVIIPFSSYEFKYRLGKIKEDILKTNNTKAKKVMNKLIKRIKKDFQIQRMLILLKIRKKSLIFSILF